MVLTEKTARKLADEQTEAAADQTARELIAEHQINNLFELNVLFKKMSGAVIEQMLEAERDDHLGYEKHELGHKDTTNRRNGYTPKTVRSDFGEIQLDIPRDRDGSFDPQLVKKHQRDITSLEEQIISMYAKGMTVRDIQRHIELIYNADLSTSAITRMTDRILPILSQWQSRPLSSVYSIVYIDGLRLKIRDSGLIKDKSAFAVMGVDLFGKKDILGLWIFESETSKHWLKVLTELKNRGLRDILILTSDGLPGIEDAVAAVFPETVYQGCVVHVIRNSTKYLSYKDRKEFCSDIKAIYQAPNEDAALSVLEAVEEKWSERAPLAVKVWQDNLDRISAMFRFTPEIRRLIYTTNPIESFNRQVRKVTKNRTLFPSDEAAMKLLYLATQDITAKWTVKLANWNSILAQLAIEFEERVTNYL